VRAERTFNEFELVETLGLGGMGAVYKARDTTRNRAVALKLLRPDLDGGNHAAQLQEEARLAAAVNHPNVVRVFSFGSDHGQFYVVMELVDGGSLDDLIEREKSLAEERVLQTGIQVAKGLRAAHAKGLIHSDVKPANILFANNETAKISDFGLAAVAAQSPEARAQIWGTPYYVAPERLNNHPEDLRSDIYSLGATLFHALAGRPPIQAETNSAAKLCKLKYQPLDFRAAMPHICEETAQVFERMLAPDPRHRLSSYDELVAELESARRAIKRAQKKEVDRALKDFKKAERARHPWLRRFAFAAALFVVAALAGGGTLVIARKPGALASVRQTFGGLLNKSATKSSVDQTAFAIGDEAQNQPKVAGPGNSWDAAVNHYRDRLARYDFLGAAAAIANAEAKDRAMQVELGKRAQWLARWKNNLIVDLNKKQFSGALADLDRVEYTGIASATADQLMLKTRYGIAGLPWSKLPPQKLLAVSASFIWPEALDAADRQWLCAVFASATGQFDEARQFAEAAAKTKPEYRREFALVVAPRSASR
jgi:tRNA A-37 threonylcarbamoyl transferase component Bud32